MSNTDASEILERLNESPWRGIITEIGFGVPVSYHYLIHPNWQQTIIQTSAPINDFSNYNKNILRENIKNALDYSQNLDQTPDRETSPRFYLAICGQHKTIKEEGESQGWLGLRTCIPRENNREILDTLIHFKLSKVYQNKEILVQEIFNLVNVLALWLFKTILLGDYKSWQDAIDNLPYHRLIHIDIIEDSRISFEEHLSLSHSTNPLIYFNGIFSRATEGIKNYSNFIIGNLDIKFDRAILIQDLENLDPNKFLDKNVIFTRERNLIPLQVSLIKKILKDQPFNIILDLNSFNKIFNLSSIPMNNSELFKNMDLDSENKVRENILTDFLEPIYKENGVSFKVYSKEDQNITSNKWLDKVNFEIIVF